MIYNIQFKCFQPLCSKFWWRIYYLQPLHFGISYAQSACILQALLQSGCLIQHLLQHFDWKLQRSQKILWCAWFCHAKALELAPRINSDVQHNLQVIHIHLTQHWKCMNTEHLLQFAVQSSLFMKSNLRSWCLYKHFGQVSCSRTLIFFIMLIWINELVVLSERLNIIISVMSCIPCYY